MKQRNNRHQNRDPFYYKHRDIFVGIFVFIVLITIPITLIYLFARSDYMKNWFTIYLKSPYSAEVMVGNRVTIMGKRVGYVSSIDLNSFGFLNVEMKIEEQYRGFIRTNSKASLKQKNIIVGDWLVDISIGGLGLDTIQNGDTLAIGHFIRIDEMVRRLTAMSYSAKEILDSIAYGHGLVTQLLFDSTAFEELPDIITSTHNLVNNADTVMVDVRNLVEKTVVTLDRASYAIASLDSFGNHGVQMTNQFMNMSDSLNQLIDSFGIVLENIDSITVEAKTIPHEVNKSLELLNHDLREIEIFIEGLKKHWFLKGAFKKRGKDK